MSTPDIRCAKCGNPQSNHPYRHIFQPARPHSQGSDDVDRVAALKAEVAKLRGYIQSVQALVACPPPEHESLLDELAYLIEDMEATDA